jgi:hypothetical protein
MSTRKKSAQRLWNNALALTLLGAALSGVGYLAKHFLDRDQSDLVVTVDSPQQAVPTIGELPVIAGDTIYCAVVRFGVVFSHNQSGHRPIRLTRVRLEWEQPPVPTGEEAALKCEVDVLNVPTHGIVELREYMLVMRGDQAEGRYLKSRASGDTLTVDPSNILRSKEVTEAVTLSPEREDAHFQGTFVLEAALAGLYRARFVAGYDVGGHLREKRTRWIYLYLPPDL